ncbi:MAG TPA: retropepsin-like aspartic protease [Chloroflexota bacterium]|nr:retropepsin-like aspartic protease [Chloroflexota bacterium]HUM69364.1 retropepsin-like aspartic protease [Chloroflexota bacterium]
MKIEVREGLPYVTTKLTYHGKTITLENVVVDTGSASTLFRTDDLLRLGIAFAADDVVEQVRGVGGVETVVAKRIESITVGDLRLVNFAVDMSVMNYGFAIDGLLGFDFLQQTGAVIDLSVMEIRASG